MGDNDSLYQTKNPLPLLQLKTFTTGHIWHWDVSEILQMNLHEIHPEFVKQKTFNICTNTTMPKISEIKEKCRAVKPPLTPHTPQSSRPESQLSRKYGSRRTCRHYITFYTEKHTMHLINQWCWDLGIYRVIQIGCPQLGCCKIGIFRSSWLVFFKKRKSLKTNQNYL